MKKLVLVLTLAMIAILTLLPTAAIAEEPYDATVYVDVANGADTNEGTAAAPKATLAAAYAALAEKNLTADDTACIVLSGTVETSGTLGEEHAYTVTITGGKLNLTGTIYLAGPTTLKSVTLHAGTGGKTFYANGHPFTVESDVATTADGNFLTIYGGKSKDLTATSTKLVLNGGTWRNVYIGNRNKPCADASIVMMDTTVQNLFSVSYDAVGTTNATITATNSSFSKLYYSGAALTTASGHYNDGDVEINLNNCSVSNFFRASDYKPAVGNPTFTGNLTLNIVDNDKTIAVDASAFQTYGAGKTMTLNVTNSLCPEFVLGEGTVLNLTASEGKTLTLTSATTATSFTGGGTLAMPVSAALTVTGSVTGETALDFGAETPFEKVYVTAPSGSTAKFTYNDTALTRADDGTNTTWAVAAGREVGKIVMSVPEGVTLRFFEGINNESDNGEIDLGTPVAANGTLTYTVKELPAGHYHYRVGPTTGTEYYKVVKNIVYDGEQLTIDANPGKRAGTGFEPNVSMKGANFSTVHFYNDLTYETLLTGGEETAKKEWGIEDYESYFATPGLKRSNLLFTENVPEVGRYQLTTNEEMYAFLRENVSAEANGYLYEDAYTFTDQYVTSDPLTYNMPVVIYSQTDLSGKNFAEAAAAVKANGKPTLFYQGQVHSNEPTGGETGMVLVRQMALDAEKQAWLDEVNVVIVPRANVIGAYYYSRYISGNGYINTYPSDINREYIMASSDEVRALLEIYNRFLPVAVLDGHECYGKTTTIQNSIVDIYISFGKTATAPTSEIVAHEKAAWDAAMAAEEACGLRAGFYADEFYKDESNTSGGVELAPTKSINMAQNYYANRGSMSFLLEARGIYAGNIRLDRRVMSHMAAIEAIFDYVVDNLDEVAANSAAARSEMLDKTTYDENDKVVLKSGKNPDDFIQTDILIFDRTTGEYIKTNTGKYVYRNLAEDTIPLPLSYIIPKGVAGVDYEGLERLAGYHDFKYTEEENLKLFVRQYDGAAGSATIGATEEVSFTDGAYVFPVSQSTGRLLALVFEPNYRDSYSAAGSYVNKTTLAGSGIVPASAIYRYEGATAAAEARRTIYVDEANGADTNDGSESSPVATIAQAFALFDAQDLTADDSVEIVLVGTVTATQYLKGSNETHAYAVTLDGKGTGTLKLTRSLSLCGPTTLKALTLHNSLTTNTEINVFAHGHKFTVESDVVTTRGSTSARWLAVFGGTSNGKSVASADMTLKAGTYRNVFAGSYNTTVADARLALENVTVGNLCSPTWMADGATNAVITAKNCAFYNLYYSGYATTTTNSVYNSGDVVINLDNCSVSQLLRASDYKPATGNPSFTGNLTINIVNNADKNITVDASAFQTYGTGKTMTINVTDSICPEFVLGEGTVLNLTASEGKTLTLNAATIADTFTGGGTLALGDGASLTVKDSVAGTTVLAPASVTTGTALVTAPAATSDTAFSYTATGDEKLSVSTSGDSKIWMLTVPVEEEPSVSVDVAAVSGTTVMVDVAVTGEVSATLIVAAYGKGEKLLAAKTQSVTASMEDAGFDFGTTFTGAVTVKAFVIDAAEAAPLCGAASYPIPQ